MRRGWEGFALVELAIVVAVIGVLAAVAVPRFLAMQEAAGKASLDANFDALRASLVALRAKFGAFPDERSFDRGRYGGAYFFPYPPAYLSDAAYNDYLIVPGARKDWIKGARLVGRDERCPQGYSKFYLLNTVKESSNASAYYADVYGAICYDADTGALRRLW